MKYIKLFEKFTKYPLNYKNLSKNDKNDNKYELYFQKKYNPKNYKFYNKELILFLISCKVFEKFIKNLNNGDITYKNKYWDNYKNYSGKIHPKYYILHGFDIEKSTEGLEFWKKIHKKWIEHINKFKNIDSWMKWVETEPESFVYKDYNFKFKNENE